MESNQQNSNGGMNMLPEHVLKNLQKCEHHADTVCLACGYQGLMGITAVDQAWYSKPAVRFALLFSVFGVFFLFGQWFYGVIFGVLAAVLTNRRGQVHYQCPNCEKDLVA